MQLFTKNSKLYSEVSGGFSIGELTACIEYEGKHYNILNILADSWKTEGKENAVSDNHPEDIVFHLNIKPFGKGAIYTLSLKAGEGVCVERVISVKLKGYLPFRVKRCVYNEPVSYKGAHLFDMQSPAETTVLCRNQFVTGAEYISFAGMKGKCGILGSVTFEKYFSTIELNENGEFFLKEELDGITINAGETIVCDAFYIALNPEQHDFLREYGEVLACCNGRRVSKPVAGWCSWYYYGVNISENIILDNARRIKRAKLPLKVIQIDDGWQDKNGYWGNNERFPKGMKAIADEIKEMGFEPGIWISPFTLDDTSEVYKRHPDWFVRQEKEVCIDFGIPEAAEYLKNIFVRLSKDWGYRYIKIDLITPRLLPAPYRTSSFNALRNYRRALQIIRDAVTEDTFILGCTVPIGASVGLADGIRISADIFERWESLKHIAAQVFKRYHYAQVFVNDPDCLMLRTKDKQDGECFRLCTRNREEIRTFITFISAAGGSVMLSDKMSLLDEKDLHDLERLFPMNTVPAVPVDLYKDAIPSVLYYGEKKGVHIYAVFNWEDRIQNIVIRHNREMFARTYWKEKKYKRSEKTSVRLLPHEAEVIYCSESAERLDFSNHSILPQHLFQ